MKITVSYYNNKYRVDIKTYDVEGKPQLEPLVANYIEDFFNRTGVRLTWMITSVAVDPVQPVVVETVEWKKDTESVSVEKVKKNVKSQTITEETQNVTI